ncbi:MAG: hypothetical protein V1834_01825 [Candidatus Micrarchaeota archaeon]
MKLDWPHKLFLNGRALDLFSAVYFAVPLPTFIFLFFFNPFGPSEQLLALPVQLVAFLPLILLVATIASFFYVYRQARKIYATGSGETLACLLATYFICLLLFQLLSVFLILPLVLLISLGVFKPGFFDPFVGELVLTIGITVYFYTYSIIFAFVANRIIAQNWFKR